MARRWMFLTVALLAAVGCSLLLRFEPEGKPCSDAGTCADGLTCVDAICRAPECTSSETSCSNGLDDDCDGTRDCEDPDCAEQACDDGLLCTVGETCGGNHQCSGGQPKQCIGLTAGGCQQEKGTCVEGVGCSVEPKPVGTSCDAGLCATSGACDGQGSCVKTPKDCGAPPNTQCYESNPGQCDEATGLCSFTPKPADAPCMDTDLCTVLDKCDGLGTCKPGPQMVCDAGACETAQCQAGVCMKQVKIDGTKCGAAPGERCCSGTCVNVSSDRNNCGSCGMKCAPAVPAQGDPEQPCLPITNLPATAATGVGPISGRCACNGPKYGNGDCRNAGSTLMQTCRTPPPDSEANVCVGNPCGPNQVAIIPCGNVNNCAPYCAWKTDAGF